jgi:predicted lactoylglutathione lyase
MYKKAIAAGGKHHRDRSDLGYMVQQAFEDPDGHVWEVFWMDPGHVE